MASTRFTVTFVAVFAVFTACQTPSTDNTATPTATARVNPIQPETILPSVFSKELGSGTGRELSVPPPMLTMAEVTRPRAELRAGPGVQFELGDALITQGTQVICFGRVGVWQRVIVLGTWQKGWVHHQALATPRPNTAAVTLPQTLLPTVLAVRPIDSVMSYPRKEALKVAIPTGTIFRSLTQMRGRVLVWLEETNSVMWVDHKDVQ